MYIIRLIISQFLSLIGNIKENHGSILIGVDLAVLVNFFPRLSFFNRVWFMLMIMDVYSCFWPLNFK